MILTVYVDAVADKMMNFVEGEFINELPVAAQAKICVLPEQSSFLFSEMRLRMNQGDDSRG
jgi:hypothetical protein